MPSLAGGGAERVVSHLCRLWNHEIVEIHLALIYKQAQIVYPLSEHVKLHRLECSRVLTSLWSCKQLIDRLQPEVIFSSMSNLNMVLLFLKLMMPKLKLVVRENNLVTINTQKDNYSWLRKMAYRFLYLRADAIICQAQVMYNEIKKNYPMLENKLEVIDNPVLIEKVEENSPFADYGSGPNILVIGRLSFQKNCQRAIQLFKDWLKTIPDAHLWFLGEGEDKDALKDLVKALDLISRVHFCGFVKEISTWLKYADLYFLCSEFEGSPNALQEALVMNCPVLVQAHPGGTKELLVRYAAEDRYLDAEKIESFDLKYLERNPDKNLIDVEKESKKIAEAYLSTFLTC